MYYSVFLDLFKRPGVAGAVSPGGGATMSAGAGEGATLAVGAGVDATMSADTGTSSAAGSGATPAALP